MKREINLSEISDGRLYRGNDMAKLDTNGCRGCSQCCREVEKTIVLDPYDMWRLQQGTSFTFDQLLEKHVELLLIDSLALPVLSMKGKDGCCTFLDENGRCAIHQFRPGICRLYPLGRYYEGGDFRYFLQVKECSQARGKVRIRKWLDTPDLPRYEDYIRSWHSFLVYMDHFLEGAGEELHKAACIYVIRLFFRSPWNDGTGFYEQFEDRLRTASEHFR